VESYLSRGKEYDQFVPSPWRKEDFMGHLKQKIPSFPGIDDSFQRKLI